MIWTNFVRLTVSGTGFHPSHPWIESNVMCSMHPCLSKSIHPYRAATTLVCFSLFKIFLHPSSPLIVFDGYDSSGAMCILCIYCVHSFPYSFIPTIHFILLLLASHLNAQKTSKKCKKKSKHKISLNKPTECDLMG